MLLAVVLCRLWSGSGLLSVCVVSLLVHVVRCWLELLRVVLALNTALRRQLGDSAHLCGLQTHVVVLALLWLLLVLVTTVEGLSRLLWRLLLLLTIYWACTWGGVLHSIAVLAVLWWVSLELATWWIRVVWMVWWVVHGGNHELGWTLCETGGIAALEFARVVGWECSTAWSALSLG